MSPLQRFSPTASVFMKRLVPGALALVSLAALVACGGGGGGGSSGGSGSTGTSSDSSGGTFQAALRKSPVAPLPGALFTTDATCSGVNVNLYEAKTEVYVDGGPERTNGAPLLANSSYYVMVTDPSGAVVLGDSGTARSATTGSDGSLNCVHLWDLVRKASDGSTGFDDTPNKGGEYKVWISADPNFEDDTTKTDNFGIKPSRPASPQSGTVTIQKFYDANVDGQYTPGVDTLMTTAAGKGWKVTLRDLAAQNTTAVYAGLPLEDGVAREFRPQQGNWYGTNAYVDSFDADHRALSSDPTYLNQVNVPLSTSRSSATVYFGNVCTGAGGGHTLGYWSNNNGQTTMTNYSGGGTAALLAQLSDLPLKGSTSSDLDFDPNTYTQFRTWILGATASNMSYMLSAQLAAMYLNVTAGNANGQSMIYAPGVKGANFAGFVTVQAVINEAKAALSVTGYTRAGVPERTYQEYLKTALDDANNDRTFLQPGPGSCALSFDNPVAP